MKVLIKFDPIVSFNNNQKNINQKFNHFVTSFVTQNNGTHRIIMDKNGRGNKKIKSFFSYLEKQNQDLKRLLQIQVSHSPLHSAKRQFQSTKFCQDLSHKQLGAGRNTDQLKKQWAEWSNRLQASIVMKNNKIRHQTETDDLRKTTNLSGSFGNESFFARKSLQSLKSEKQQEVINLDIKTPGKSELMLDESLSLIEDIFLFGPSLNDIQKAEQRKFIASHQLYFPEAQKPDFQVYGNYLFPKQLQVKHIREKNHNVELNKIIFKNNKKLDCNIFIFYQDKQSNQKLQKSNKLLDKVNPSKWLYALSIKFSDFVTAVNENVSSSVNNKTFTMMNEVQNKNERFIEGDMIRSKEKKQFGGTASKKTIITEQQIFKSNFCLCIMTYFPFIRFLKDILIEVFDSVKLRRMNKYSNCTSYKEIDIYFFIEELKVQLSKFLQQKLKVEAVMGKMYEFPINEVQMKLDLSESNLINQMIGDWGFKILKQMDKDTLLDVFCYIMLQQSVCFICQDKSVLTFIILLYIVVFSLPFGYPHPCISIVFNDELLDSPFIGVLGINESSKWVEQNLQWLTGNKENKILVNLNEDEVKIKFKKKPRTHKSQKLKKIFTSFYRKIETSSMPSIFKKKMELITRETTKQENEHVGQLFSELNVYFQQQLFNHLPNPQIIELIKQSFVNNAKNSQEGYNANTMYNVVVGKIEKYLGQSRKSKNKDGKDGFIDELVKKQLFWLYMDEIYGLK